MSIEFWNDHGFPKMVTVHPDGATAGTARIKHIGVSKHDAGIASIRAMSSGRGCVRDGDVYAQLYVNGTMWMSDTRDEQRDHSTVLWKAKGEVLIGGLGLGMVALGIALKPEVTRVTVIELNADVIALVEPHLRAALEAAGLDPNKLVIIQGDVYEWKPEKGQKFDTIWMDGRMFVAKAAHVWDPTAHQNPFNPVVVRPRPERPVTTERLISALRNSPELLADFARQFRVVGPWEKLGNATLARRDTSSGAPIVVVIQRGFEEPYYYTWEEKAADESGTFRRVGSDVRCETLDEALAAADAHLARKGWILLPAEVPA